MLAGMAILTLIALPRLGGTPLREDQAICANNLQLLAMGIHGWALDHGEDFPWKIYQKYGGSRGLPFTHQHWMVLSNYLPSVKALVCPATPRHPARSFATLNERNTSYLVGSDSEMAQPATLLSADLDILGGTEGTCWFVGTAVVQRFAFIFGVPDTGRARWSTTNHVGRGNVLSADGSVRQTDSAGLRSILSVSTDNGNDSHSLIPR